MSEYLLGNTDGEHERLIRQAARLAPITDASEAGLHNVRFVEGDVTRFSSETLFDAAVGRFILQFLPDPVAVLRSVSALVRPGGAVAFQENSWGPFVLFSAHLPL